eukprot:TRINITY_DN1918_c0_g1_i1.p1 TRINITY_DN1918_c0_g1~~TRINITY_DN1918_c0_g1_i1.p1  ORF type:complete len:1484 (+),score=470.20 TRINITY_DN1918_c0_g1_i1:94-4545(+)
MAEGLLGEDADSLSLRDLVVETADKIGARLELAAEQTRLMGAHEREVKLFSDVHATVDELLRDLLAEIPKDDEDLKGILLPTDDVQRLQQHVSLLKQRIYDLRILIAKKEHHNRIIRGRLQWRTRVIDYVRRTLYNEVIILREDLRQRANSKENPDIGVFSLFDFLKVIDAEGNSDDSSDLKHQVEDLLLRWKAEEAQKLDLERRHQEAQTAMEKFREKCTQLEDSMQSLSTRFTDEFIKLKTQKLMSDKYIKQLQHTVEEMQRSMIAQGASTQELMDKAMREQQERADMLMRIEQLSGEIEELNNKHALEIAAERTKLAVEERKWQRKLEAGGGGTGPASGSDAASQLYAEVRPDKLEDEDPRYIVELRRLGIEHQDRTEELQDWRALCEQESARAEELRRKVVDLSELVQESKSLRAGRGREEAGLPEMTKEQLFAKCREQRADLNMIVRRMGIMCDRYSVLLDNFDEEDKDVAAEGSAAKRVLAQIRRDAAQRAKMQKLPEATKEEEEDRRFVSDLADRLDQVDKRLRQRLQGDHRDLGRLADTLATDRQLWSQERSDWLEIWRKILPRIPKEVLEDLRRIIGSDAGIDELIAEALQQQEEVDRIARAQREPMGWDTLSNPSDAGAMGRGGQGKGGKRGPSGRMKGAALGLMRGTARAAAAFKSKQPSPAKSHLESSGASHGAKPGGLKRLGDKARAIGRIQRAQRSIGGGSARGSFNPQAGADDSEGSTHPSEVPRVGGRTSSVHLAEQLSAHQSAEAWSEAGEETPRPRSDDGVSDGGDLMRGTKDWSGHEFKGNIGSPQRSKSAVAPGRRQASPQGTSPRADSARVSARQARSMFQSAASDQGRHIAGKRKGSGGRKRGSDQDAEQGSQGSRTPGRWGGDDDPDEGVTLYARERSTAGSGPPSAHRRQSRPGSVGSTKPGAAPAAAAGQPAGPPEPQRWWRDRVLCPACGFSVPCEAQEPDGALVPRWLADAPPAAGPLVTAPPAVPAVPDGAPPQGPGSRPPSGNRSRPSSAAQLTVAQHAGGVSAGTSPMHFGGLPAGSAAQSEHSPRSGQALQPARAASMHSAGNSPASALSPAFGFGGFAATLRHGDFRFGGSNLAAAGAAVTAAARDAARRVAVLARHLRRALTSGRLHAIEKGPTVHREDTGAKEDAFRLVALLQQLSGVLNAALVCGGDKAPSWLSGNLVSDCAAACGELGHTIVASCCVLRPFDVDFYMFYSCSEAEEMAMAAVESEAPREEHADRSTAVRARRASFGQANRSLFLGRDGCPLPNNLPLSDLAQRTGRAPEELFAEAMRAYSALVAGEPLPPRQSPVRALSAIDSRSDPLLPLDPDAALPARDTKRLVVTHPWRRTQSPPPPQFHHSLAGDVSRSTREHSGRPVAPGIRSGPEPWACDEQYAGAELFNLPSLPQLTAPPGAAHGHVPCTAPSPEVVAPYMREAFQRAFGAPLPQYQQLQQHPTRAGSAKARRQLQPGSP